MKPAGVSEWAGGMLWMDERSLIWRGWPLEIASNEEDPAEYQYRANELISRLD